MPHHHLRGLCSPAPFAHLPVFLSGLSSLFPHLSVPLFLLSTFSSLSSCPHPSHGHTQLGAGAGTREQKLLPCSLSHRWIQSLDLHGSLTSFHPGHVNIFAKTNCGRCVQVGTASYLSLLSLLPLSLCPCPSLPAVPFLVSLSVPVCVPVSKSLPPSSPWKLILILTSSKCLQIGGENHRPGIWARQLCQWPRSKLDFLPLE